MNKVTTTRRGYRYSKEAKDSRRELAQKIRADLASGKVQRDQIIDVYFKRRSI